MHDQGIGLATQDILSPTQLFALVSPLSPPPPRSPAFPFLHPIHFAPQNDGLVRVWPAWIGMGLVVNGFGRGGETPACRREQAHARSRSGCRGSLSQRPPLFLLRLVLLPLGPPDQLFEKGPEWCHLPTVQA
ncbi:hypothetical protein TCAL_15844 [Tigriopus californicus]|uniref:Uncharacterized protein n=1 Tax=Tigriopus californicus TaxID=6832 RepID=A0A553NPG4_TIGCA|nr:hypothetical protein TCAL_15844 [Tigriopus californicus]